jgi:hypothetical protein
MSFFFIYPYVLTRGIVYQNIVSQFGRIYKNTISNLTIEIRFVSHLEITEENKNNA